MKGIALGIHLAPNFLLLQACHQPSRPPPGASPTPRASSAWLQPNLEPLPFSFVQPLSKALVEILNFEFRRHFLFRSTESLQTGIVKKGELDGSISDH